MDRVVLVANPTSGGGRARRVLPGAVSALRSVGIEHRVVVTHDGAHASEVAAEAARAGVRAVVAVGGDGLVGTCAAALAGTSSVLAVVPAGTGNDLARNLGLDPKDPFRSVSCLAEGRIRRIDTVAIEGRGWTARYSCVAGAGFDSEANELANSLTRLRGTPRYVAAVFRTLVRFQPARFSLWVDGREQEGRAMMVAVGNATSYGGGMRICPDALLDDGVVDVCVVGALPKLEFAATFPRVFRGTHVDHPAVRFMRGRRVQLSADRPFRVYGDGEPLGHLPATFTVDPRSLEVAAP
ncbi:MAG: diacylglycerol/lipid kinase family protein [Actinomycetota bacterium]